MVTCLLDWTCESFAVSPHTSYLARKISFLEHLVKIFLVVMSFFFLSCQVVSMQRKYTPPCIFFHIKRDES